MSDQSTAPLKDVVTSFPANNLEAELAQKAPKKRRRRRRNKESQKEEVVLGDDLEIPEGCAGDAQEFKVLDTSRKGDEQSKLSKRSKPPPESMLLKKKRKRGDAATDKAEPEGHKASVGLPELVLPTTRARDEGRSYVRYLLRKSANQLIRTHHHIVELLRQSHECNCPLDKRPFRKIELEWANFIGAGKAENLQD